MIKKRITAALMAIMVIGLNGCGGTQPLMHPWTEQGSSLEFNADYMEDTAKAPLFADNLCVVPVGSDKDKDGNLNGVSTMLADVTDRKILYSNQVFKRVYPASVTKIVTTLVLLKHGNLDEMVTVSHAAANITEPGATKCGIMEGDKIRMEALLISFLLKSGNDAGIAIAEHVAGSVEAFADMMNEEVEALGGVDSHFVNPHGLHDADHYTTAYDIYLVFNELLNYEKYLSIINMKEYEAVYEDKDGTEVRKTFTTSNRFINGRENAPDGITVIGGKTGTTSKAGSCLVLYSKDEKEHEYLSLIFKSASADSLFSQMSYLLRMINK